MEYSVVVPTYNRSKSLKATLNSVAGQSLPPALYEIIVVDDGSTDDTRQVVLGLQKKHPNHNIKYYYQENSGPAKARNTGIKNSRGNTIFFTDDDCIVLSNWIETLLDGYRRYPDVVGVGGWQDVSTRLLKLNYFLRYLSYLSTNRNSPHLSTEVRTNLFDYSLSGNTANMSYKKNVLEEAGGFDENLYFTGSEDRDLKKRLQNTGYFLLYTPIKVEHLKKLGLREFVIKFFNQGRGRYYMSLKHPDLGEHPDYNPSPAIFLKRVVRHFFSGDKFFWGSTLAGFNSLFGRYYVKYFKPFDKIGASVTTSVSGRETLKTDTSQEKALRTTYKLFSPLVEYRRSSEFACRSCLSVIIPTYNRCQSLVSTLEAVADQAIPPQSFEILIIDDGSTDHTKEVVLDFKKRYPIHNIRYIYQENSGPAKARNNGVKNSRGDIIFFTDDDCVVPRHWIETLLDGYRRYPDTVGVGGWYISAGDILKKNPFERYLHYNYFLTTHRFYHGQLLLRYEIFSNDPAVADGVFANNTANLSLKKEYFKKVGGFREDFFQPGSEDVDLVFRLVSRGFKMLYWPLQVIHLQNLGAVGFLRFWFNRGVSLYIYKKANKDALEKIRPGLSVDNCSLSFLVSLLLERPQKFLALVHFLSHKAGLMYMRYKFGKLT